MSAFLLRFVRGDKLDIEVLSSSSAGLRERGAPEYACLHRRVSSRRNGRKEWKLWCLFAVFSNKTKKPRTMGANQGKLNRGPFVEQLLRPLAQRQ